MKPARKRRWSIARAHGGEHPPGCRALPVDRSTYQYRPRRSSRPGTKEDKEIERRGCARLSAHPRAPEREGWAVNANAFVGYTAKWACNYATRRRNGGQGKLVRTARRQPANDILGDGLRDDQLFDGRRFGRSHRRYTDASVAGPRCPSEVMSSKTANTARQSSAIPKRSASTMAPSSSEGARSLGVYERRDTRLQPAGK